MARQVEIIARTRGEVMLEGGRAHGYTPTLVSERWWALYGRRFGHMVMTVDAYAQLICKHDVVQLRAECTRRDIDRSGSVHEMRAALLDGIAPYEPSKHPTEADDQSDTEEVPDTEDTDTLTDVDRVKAADDKNALKALVDEFDMGDDVDLRYGADKLRAAMLDVLEGDDGKDS